VSVLKTPKMVMDSKNIHHRNFEEKILRSMQVMTFWMIEISRDTHSMWSSNKFTIAPGDKRNSDITCCGWLILNEVRTYRESPGSFFNPEKRRQ
jgi:hypothetical protein